MSTRIDAVIDEIEAHRQNFESWCRSLSDEELMRPVPGSTWVVKDFISHLATIDTTVAEWFRSLASDNPETVRPEGNANRFNIDDWNDAQVAKRRDRSLDEIFEEAGETRALIIERLRAFDDEALDREIAFGGDSKRAPTKVRLGQYLSGWARHDPIHVNDMIRALPERRQDAEVTAWLDDTEIGPLARGYAKQMGWEEPA